MSKTNKEILRLAIPSILANITIPLVGIVDTAIVGHLSDAAAIGGIAIGTMLFDLLYWNFGFLRVGTSGLTAQAYGSGDETECRKILLRSLSIAMMAAVVILAIQWLFVTAVLGVRSAGVFLRPYLGCTRDAESLHLQGLVHRHAGHQESHGGRYTRQRGKYGGELLPRGEDAVRRRWRGVRHARGAV